MNRFLKAMLVLYIGNSLINRMRKRPGFQGAGKWQKSGKASRYSLDSERLWEDTPTCNAFRIRYRSESLNKNKEPVFFTRAEPYLVSPVRRVKLPGCFSAHPGGLNIDPATGEIDINQSDTGTRYQVNFMPCGHTCTAKAAVVIAGIGYEGGVFSLSSPEELASRPYYYGDNPREEVPTRNVPPGRFGYIPDNVKPTANLLGLKINEQTGAIDLRDTIRSGALGFRRDQEFPENGASKEFKVYYRLQPAAREEQSGHTTLRIHFYDSADLIPEELLARIKQQKGSLYWQGFALPLVLGTPYTWFSDSPWEVLVAAAAALTSLLFLTTRESNNPLRPPEHCVTQ
jgi:hypothetical protein